MKHWPWAGIILAAVLGLGGWFGVPRVKRHRCLGRVESMLESLAPGGVKPQMQVPPSDGCLVSVQGEPLVVVNATEATRAVRWAGAIPVEMQKRAAIATDACVYALIDLDSDPTFDVWVECAGVRTHVVDDLAD